MKCIYRIYSPNEDETTRQIKMKNMNDINYLTDLLYVVCLLSHEEMKSSSHVRRILVYEGLLYERFITGEVDSNHTSIYIMTFSKKDP